MIRLDLLIYEMCHLSEHFLNAQVLNFEKDLNCRVGQCYEAINLLNIPKGSPIHQLEEQT